MVGIKLKVGLLSTNMSSLRDFDLFYRFVFYQYVIPTGLKIMGYGRDYIEGGFIIYQYVIPTGSGPNIIYFFFSGSHSPVNILVLV